MDLSIQFTRIQPVFGSYLLIFVSHLELLACSRLTVNLHISPPSRALLSVGSHVGYTCRNDVLHLSLFTLVMFVLVPHSPFGIS